MDAVKNDRFLKTLNQTFDDKKENTSDVTNLIPTCNVNFTRNQVSKSRSVKRLSGQTGQLTKYQPRTTARITGQKNDKLLAFWRVSSGTIHQSRMS